MRTGFEDCAGSGGIALYRFRLSHGGVYPTRACAFYDAQPVRHTGRLSPSSHPKFVRESQPNWLHSMVELRSCCAHGHPGISQHGRTWRTDRGSCSCGHRHPLNRARAIKAASGVSVTPEPTPFTLTGSRRTVRSSRSAAPKVLLPRTRNTRNCSRRTAGNEKCAPRHRYLLTRRFGFGITTCMPTFPVLIPGPVTPSARYVCTRCSRPSSQPEPLVNNSFLGWVRQFLCLLEISRDFLKSVEWVASRPSSI